MILHTLVAAVALGIAAQLLAERFRLPAILPLLVFGIVAGPHVLGWMEPDSLGHFLEEFIHLGVAVILFEGGLSLNLGQLSRVGGAVRNLLSLGLVITGVMAAMLAHWITGMPWGVAALFGAILTVTGPTVIVPLLRHMIAPRKVKTVLVSEGLIIDPIGAVLAYLVLQWIERAGVPIEQLAVELLKLSLYGAVIGYVAGKLGVLFAQRRVSAGELRNLTVLALVLVCYLAAEVLAPQSGILAVVVMGITMSAAEIPDLEPLRTFKEQLTTLLISILFILLSGQLDLQAVASLGWRGVAVAFGLILLVRPISVFLSVWPHQLPLRQRVVLALTAPRGIVAAAVASLAARELSSRGIPGGPELEGLVYVSILITGAWATFMAPLLPRVLGFLDDPSRRLTVLVGANPLSRALARTLQAEGRKTVVVDSVSRKLEAMRKEGIGAVRGDARDADTYEKAGVERDTQVLALTTNDELNLLVAGLVHAEFGVEHPVVALQAPSPEFGSRRQVWIDLLGGQALEVALWQRRLEEDRARFIQVPVPDAETTERLREILESEPKQAAIVCGWDGELPYFHFESDFLEKFERVTLLVSEGEVVERVEQLLAELAQAGEEDVAPEALEEVRELDAEADPEEEHAEEESIEPK